MNPYTQVDFFSFIVLFFKRCFFLIMQPSLWQNLSSDEQQIFILIGISVSGALLGSFLVLRKMVMVANAISHTVLLGVVGIFIIAKYSDLRVDSIETIYSSLPLMLSASFLSAMLTMVAIYFLNSVLKLQRGASIGLIFTAFFAIGVVLLTVFSRNAHIGNEIIIGNIDLVNIKDLKLVMQVMLINISLVAIFYKGYSLTSFDPNFAHSLGVSNHRYSLLLMMQTSATVIVALKSVGIVLILIFLTAPVLTARLFVTKLHHLIFLSIGIGIFSSIISVALARHLLTILQVSLSTGALVAMINVFIFSMAAVISCLLKRKVIAR